MVNHQRATRAISAKTKEFVMLLQSTIMKQNRIQLLMILLLLVGFARAAVADAGPTQINSKQIFPGSQDGMVIAWVPNVGGAFSNLVSKRFECGVTLGPKAPNRTDWTAAEVEMTVEYGDLTGGPLVTVQSAVPGQGAIKFNLPDPTSSKPTLYVTTKQKIANTGPNTLPIAGTPKADAHATISLNSSGRGPCRIKVIFRGYYKDNAGRENFVELKADPVNIKWTIDGSMLGPPGPGGVQVAVRDWTSVDDGTALLASSGSQLPETVTLLVPPGTTITNVRVAVDEYTALGGQLDLPNPLGYDFPLFWSGSSTHRVATSGNLGTLSGGATGFTYTNNSIFRITQNPTNFSGDNYIQTIFDGDYDTSVATVTYNLDGAPCSVSASATVPLISDAESEIDDDGTRTKNSLTLGGLLAVGANGTLYVGDWGAVYSNPNPTGQDPNSWSVADLHPQWHYSDFIRISSLAVGSTGLVCAGTDQGPYLSDNGYMPQGYPWVYDTPIATTVDAAGNVYADLAGYHPGFFVYRNGEWDGAGGDYPIALAASGNAVYAFTTNYFGTDVYIEETTDGGHTWTRNSSNLYHGQSYYGSTLAVSPIDPNTLCLAYDGPSFSHDGGASWSGAPTPGGAFGSIAFDAGDVNTAYVASPGYAQTSGLWKTTDGGQTWTPIQFDEEPGESIVSVATDPNIPGLVYISTGDLYPLMSSDGGINWQPIEGPPGEVSSE